jgi:hypothetical protein
MRTYARIQNGTVVELLKTDGDITAMFNPALVWVDISSQPDVSEGWDFDGTHFTRPPTQPASTPVPSIAELHAQLEALSAQIAAMTGKG